MIKPDPVALTQTLHSRYYKYKAITQLGKIFPLLEKLLKQTCMYYIIQAELTEKGNIHFHGTVTFISDIHKFIYVDSVRTLGMYYMKLIHNIEEWTKYYRKSTRQTLEKLQLPITEKSLKLIRKEFKADLIKIQETLNLMHSNDTIETGIPHSENTDNHNLDDTINDIIVPNNSETISECPLERGKRTYIERLMQNFNELRNDPLFDSIFRESQNPA